MPHRIQKYYPYDCFTHEIKIQVDHAWCNLGDKDNKTTCNLPALYQINYFDILLLLLLSLFKVKSLSLFSLNSAVKNKWTKKKKGWRYDFVDKKVCSTRRRISIGVPKCTPKWSMTIQPLNPSTSRQRKENPDSSLASYPSWNNKIPVQWQTHLKPIKRVWHLLIYVEHEG